MLPLFTRRWFPFDAPAAYWILTAALSLVDGVLLPSIESLFLVGSASAALLGNLRNASQAWTGLVIVPRWHYGGCLQHPRPHDRRAHPHSRRWRSLIPVDGGRRRAPADRPGAP
jgi:hypothetical protein